MSDRCSVLSWLETVPSEYCRKSKRKREAQKGHDFRPRSVRPLVEINANLMPRLPEDRGVHDERKVQQSLPTSPAKERITRAKSRGPPVTPRKGPAERRGQSAQAQHYEHTAAVAEQVRAHNIHQDHTDWEEPTPKAGSQGTVGPGSVLSLPCSKSKPEASLSSHSRTSTNDDVSSTRSRSPVKRMADLLIANRPTKLCDLDGAAAERLGGIMDRYERLVSINRGQQVIPLHLRVDLEKALHKHDWPSDCNYISLETIDEEERDYQHTWTDQLQKVTNQAKRCVKEFHSEASWNGRVHERILELVVQNPKYNGSMDYLNITEAHIQPPSLSPSHLSGTSMQSKLVDLAIVLKPTAQMEEQIYRTLTHLDKASQSINQSANAALRLNPISLSIETKVPFSGGDVADVQLSIWAGAGLLRLTHILKQHGRDGDEIPTLPLLTFYGHDLFLSAMKQEGARNNLYGQLPIGSTRTLLGAFQMVAALDVLVDWSDKDYREWLAAVLEE